MFRNILGSLLALLGAAAVVHSPFRLWYGGRPGREFGLAELFSADGISAARPALLYGLLLPMLVTALITVVAVLLRSRILVTLAGLIALGSTVLWMVRQGQAAGSLTAGNDGLGIGVAEAAGGAVVILLGAVIMRGRRPKRRRRSHGEERARYDDERYEPHAPAPYEQQPYGQQYGQQYGEPYGQDYGPQYGQGAHDTAEPYPEPGPQPPVQWAGMGQQRGRDEDMGMDRTQAIGRVRQGNPPQGRPQDQPWQQQEPAPEGDMDRTQVIGRSQEPGGSHDAAQDRDPDPDQSWAPRQQQEPQQEPQHEQEPPAAPESGDTQRIPRTPPGPGDRN